MILTGKAEPTKAIIQGMRLSLEQEANLVREFMERFSNTRKEMGWRGPKLSYDGLLGKWQRYTSEFEGDFSHRAQEDELYEKVNSSDNVPQRAIRVFKAKANAKLLNTEPWFTVGQSRRGKEDPRIKLVDEYYHELIEEAEGRQALTQAIQGASIRGVQVLKITSRVDQVHKRADVRVLLIGGHVLADSAGRPVTDQDEWQDDPESPEGARILKRDPRIRIIGEPDLSDPVNIPVTDTMRRGLAIDCKPWQDFYCSPMARSIHEADCFDVYDLDVDDMLSRMYAGGGKLSEAAQAWLESIRKDDGTAKTDSGQAQENRGEREEPKDSRPKTQIAEGWIKLDADGDNRAEELHVVMDVDREVPIYYNYMQEASPTGRKPYALLRAIPLEERWYGVGFYELLDNQHKFIDRQRNRIDARSGTTGHILMKRAGAFRDEKFGVPVGFNKGRFYTVEDGIEFQDAVGAFTLPPIADQLWKMLESERQNAQLLSGTLTPQDQDFSNSPGADTLGGLELMAKESEILNDDALQGLILGIRDTLDQGARVTLTPEHFDLSKCTDIMEEDAAAVQSWVAEGQGRTLSRRIKLLLTKTRSLQQLQANKQAIEILAQWDMLLPEQQIRYKDIYIDILNSLEVDSPDEVLGDPKLRLEAMMAAGATNTGTQNGDGTTQIDGGGASGLAGSAPVTTSANAGAPGGIPAPAVAA